MAGDISSSFLDVGAEGATATTTGGIGIGAGIGAGTITSGGLAGVGAIGTAGAIAISGVFIFITGNSPMGGMGPMPHFGPYGGRMVTGIGHSPSFGGSTPGGGGTVHNAGSDPASNAEGPHTVIKTDPATGKIIGV